MTSQLNSDKSRYFSRMLPGICMILVMVLTTQSVAGVIYVDAGALPGGNGMSWTNAFAFLRDALNVSKPGDSVWVAKGTYYPTTNDNRDVSFELKKGVSVFGGFSGNESKLNERDWQHNITILSGDIGRKGYAEDNSYHVVTGADNAALDGFVISNGYAAGGRGGRRQQRPSRGGQRRPGMGSRNGPTGPPFGGRYPLNMQGGAFPGRPGAQSGGIHTTPQAIMQSSQQSSGAGMLNFQSAPTVRNCNFENNHAGKGGAVYNMTTTRFPPRPGQKEPVPIFINCRFTNNTARGRGGGVSNDMGTSPVFLSCVFESNRCERKGGAIYNDFGCSPVIINCLFTKNHATSAAGVGNDGSSSPVLYFCTFTFNTAEDFGPTLYQGSGPSNNPVLLNSVIWGNHCMWESVGIYNWHDCQPVVQDSIVEGGYRGKGNSSTDPALDDLGIAREDKGYRGADERFTEKHLAALLRQLASYRTTRPGGRGVHISKTENVKIPSSDRIVYVNARIPAPGNGKTWKTAYRNLTDALLDAKGDGAQIWIAGGMYIPRGKGRSATFQLFRGVRLYGGFAGNEMAMNQRNLEENTTILSGDIGDKNKAEDNCYHVLIGANGASLDGFTIRDGYADGAAYDAKGGGLILYKRARQDRPNLPIATGYSVDVRNCIFTANHALSGGAIYSYDRAKSTFIDCAFVANSADNGGAVYDCVGSAPVYERCRFMDNHAVWRAGAGFFDYGARPTITECTFSNNAAGAHGGSIFSVSRASQLENTTIAITKCRFENNWSKGNGGAGAFHDNTIVSISRSTFQRNSAGGNGGAISVTEGSSLQSSGNSFDGNKAEKEGNDLFEAFPEE